jgi:hypothetical protein
MEAKTKRERKNQELNLCKGWRRKNETETLIMDLDSS